MSESPPGGRASQGGGAWEKDDQVEVEDKPRW